MQYGQGILQTCHAVRQECIRLCKSTCRVGQRRRARFDVYCTVAEKFSARVGSVTGVTSSVEYSFLLEDSSDREKGDDRRVANPVNKDTISKFQCFLSDAKGIALS